MGSFIKLDTYILQDKVSSLERKNDILYPEFRKRKFPGYHQGRKGESDLKSEEYDAPPPLPSPTVVRRRQSMEKIHNSAHMTRYMKKIPSKNLKEHAKNVEKSERTERVSNTSEEYSFEDLDSLINVSRCLMAGNGDSLKQEESSSVKGKVSYVSPSLIQVMINSTLRWDPPKDLPKHIVNFQPSDDPFSYLKATKTVRRWQEQST
ncbi:hypothetical protein LSM04_005440 [Trypanosoma melophagium]|uniref:uncharacterized protein n=1 Tax=Trypanosoma melophagium TaxID=715481 RepID=UPI00351A3886|nr:hypothetical protein LSM04_005440 [Trypanosoma melophagium]